MIYILYHANCADGFAAMVYAKRVMKDAECIPCQYGKTVWDYIPEVTDKDFVYIVDFSFPRQQLIDLLARAGGVLVLDHHKTAEADLEGLRFCTFDMNLSGAQLAQREFGGDPRLADLVGDRDLWKFEIDGSREFNYGLGTIPWTFEEWDNMDIDAVLSVGRGIKKFVDKQVERSVLAGRLTMLCGIEAWAVNCPQNISEVGEAIYTNPDLPNLAVMWFQTNDEKIIYSLRSNVYDCSEIARNFGGGGHAGAAGFSSEGLIL